MTCMESFHWKPPEQGVAEWGRWLGLCCPRWLGLGGFRSNSATGEVDPGGRLADPRPTSQIHSNQQLSLLVVDGICSVGPERQPRKPLGDWPRGILGPSYCEAPHQPEFLQPTTPSAVDIKGSICDHTNWIKKFNSGFCLEKQQTNNCQGGLTTCLSV